MSRTLNPPAKPATMRSHMNRKGKRPEIGMTPKEFARIREQLEMSQEGMAAALGTRRNTIARWERGERPILPVTALAIRHLLCCIKKP